MEIMQAIVLGIVQGLTEFLPVSSSAHLIIVPWLLSWTNSVMNQHRLAFDVSLHLGTLLALLAFFSADWVRLFHAGMASIAERRIGDDPDRRLAWSLVIGTIPAGVAGFFAESKIERLFYSPNSPEGVGRFIAMAICLAVGGLALWAADHFGRQRRRLEQLTLRDVIVIGLAQALSILPGVSRSGSTIMAGLALRLERPAAARFSFLLSAPIIMAVCLKKLFDIVHEVRSGDLSIADLQVFAVGVVASLISGYFCIRFLLRFLQSNSTAIFAIYRCIAAGLILWIAFNRA
jgi:undecaprenyl-diphosphatase